MSERDSAGTIINTCITLGSDNQQNENTGFNVVYEKVGLIRGYLDVH